MFGDYGSAWTLKSQFLKGYIATLLTKFKLSNINASQAGSYYDINICKYEYGNESSWRRKDGSKTIKRLSFAYTCNTTNKKSGKQGLMDAVQFFFLCMKKRDKNPIGSLLVDHLKEHLASLYDYLLKKNQMKSKLPRTSRTILTSIIVLDSCFIGMIVLITGWWTMTLFAY